ncbi:MULTISPECIES: HisA/HisF-related TIM barrel protein [unclassified Thioalkalivibrio]|uniref:HisA/HisF-related TIM barrel protein n=1 Tax=unclassified Thioalkalivibrio TaxID=2621013 RepID=UPI0003A624C8|nr:MULTISPECIES: HisA/HisF-related TIM barrel protein [unclassified Thioalkalivibrio]
MKVIPVIDLLRGEAVHARRGHRDTYQPLRTPTCADGDALTLARYYTVVLGLDLIYIADLDAIQGRGSQAGLLHDIAAEISPATLWVDAGIRQHGDLEPLLSKPGILPVIGSENLVDTFYLADPESGRQTVLSLDFAEGQFLGPPTLEEQACFWTGETILMDISRVGTAHGPNLTRLSRYQRAAPSVGWFVAGGIRNARDLATLKKRGAAGALLATSLHNGQITHKEVAALVGSD